MLKIFNVSSSNCFVNVLAEKLLKEYKNDQLELANVLILLPNKRACRSLSDAFVRLQGMKPTLLPQMVVVGDIQEEELFLKGLEVENDILSLPPVIEPLERKLLFMRLIISRYKEFGLEKVSLSQACSLAQELGNLIDTASMFGLDWQNLKNLAPEEYAEHWQETLKFLSIVTTYWPEILREKGVVDAGWRKNFLIEKQSEIWLKQKTKQRIIVAGTTAVSPMMKNMVKVVLSLPNGEVWLAGLDKVLDRDAWDKVDESHPQFELKQLLDFLKINRNDVKDILPPLNISREKIISEIMRPAESSDKWLDIDKDIGEKAIKGLKLVECDDQRIEALVVALIIRKLLEEREQTIALVTPDRMLARRVASELQRWDIVIDDSAGVPLAQTSWGIFMRLCIAAIEQQTNKHNVLALMKHKFFVLGKNKKQIESLVERLDKNVWRKGDTDGEAEDLLNLLMVKAEKFANLLSQNRAKLSELLKEHVMFAESIASSDKQQSGGDVLWCAEDGEVGASFVSDWLSKADILGDIETSEYLSLFEAMMSGIVVRKKGNIHQRVRILGPIEARLNHFDYIILGGFNDGVWPVLPVADPWMSRPMKKDFGFDQPEKQIGVLALDLANLLGAKNVWLTRSKMNAGNPTIKSRWWMRLETILLALERQKQEMIDVNMIMLAKSLDEPSSYTKIEAPAPKPPVSARPRKMSASAFEKLLRDPYSVYAEYILSLKPLDDLEKNIDVRDFGNIVHGVLDRFGKEYPTTYPENAEKILLKMLENVLYDLKIANDKKIFWYPKVIKMIQWFINNEKDYRKEVLKVHNEIWGSFSIDNLPAGKFEIYAKADRVDELVGGKVNIIDYKTGRARTVNEVKKGYAPQLPIEALIASKGGFDGINREVEVDRLMYWKLGDKIVNIDEGINDILQATYSHITEVINLFDFESTGYLSRPNPKAVLEYSDYEHLARVKEWSVKDDGEDE